MMNTNEKAVEKPGTSTGKEVKPSRTFGFGDFLVLGVILVSVHYAYKFGSAAYSQFYPKCVALEQEDGSRAHGWFALSHTNQWLFQDRPNHWTILREATVIFPGEDEQEQCSPYVRPQGMIL